MRLSLSLSLSLFVQTKRTDTKYVIYFLLFHGLFSIKKTILIWTFLFLLSFVCLVSSAVLPVNSK